MVRHMLRRHLTHWDSFCVPSDRPSATVAWAYKLIYAGGALACLLYGLSVVQFGVFNVLGPHGPFAGTEGAIAATWSRWNDQLFAPLAGMEYFDGPGSVTFSQAARHGRAWYYISPHAVCGGVMALCAIVLMNERFRHGKLRRWHRLAGDIYVLAHVCNLYGSLGYLIRHTFTADWRLSVFPEQPSQSTSAGGLFGGSLFVLILWLYWAAAAASLSFGVFHICRGEVQRHRAWMALNYGTTLGAPALRVFWAMFAVCFPQYRQDEINNVSVVLFIEFMCAVAAGYTSFAHHKQCVRPQLPAGARVSLLLFALVSAALVTNQSLLRFVGFPDLNVVLGGSARNSQAAAAHAQELFAAAGPCGVVAGAVHAISWSTALVTGAILLPRELRNPTVASEGWLGFAYALSAAVAAVSTTRLSGPLSFSLVLGSPSPQTGHFYALFHGMSWDSKGVVTLATLAVFWLASRFGDEGRTTEWLLHSYGQVAFYGLYFPLTWAFGTALPSFEDAVAHAWVAAQLGATLVAYVCSVYVMIPEPESTSAYRRGLFADWRSSHRREPKKDA